MKKFKFVIRVLSLMLVLIMAISTIVSCGDDKVNENTGDVNNNVSTDETGESLKLPNINFDDANFNILCRKEDYAKDLHIDKLDTGSSTVDEKVYNRNNFIEETYGVNFVIFTDGQNEIATAVSTAVLADPDEYDLIANHGRTIFAGVTSNYYYDWNKLEHINTNASWWNQSANKNWRTPNGKLFAMNGDMSYQSVGVLGGMYFNKDIIDNAKAKSPYDYVKEDIWTLENFGKLVIEVDSSLAGDSSGNIGTDSFGYATQRWRGPSFAYMCSGQPLLKLGNDGKYVINADNERIVNSFEQYLQILENGSCYYGPNDADLGPVRDAFKAGRVAFYDDNLSTSVIFKGLDLNYGIVPFPKYDELTDGYYSTIGTGTNTFAVLSNITERNAEKISVVLEAMAYYGQKQVISYYYDELLSYQAMKDVESLEMLQLIHDGASVEMIQYTNYGEIVDLPRKVLEMPMRYGTSIATAVKVVRSIVEQELELWYALDSAN